jgi:type VI secretion system secreted protein VgrG
LQSSHAVVERQVLVRSYTPRDATARLDGEITARAKAPTTYGDACRFGEPYVVMGDALAEREALESESGYFFARLHQEQFFNSQTQLSGTSSSASLAPGQVLTISGGAPHAFASGAVLTELTTTAARDRSLTVTFKAIPFSQQYCFRPQPLAKPQIAGTVPARITTTQPNAPYGHINLEGRYKVSFLFDRDTWAPGGESLWLRLARPYAGATHGLHLPLLAGTEVAIAFEEGDPDRPYIAHALHDSQHGDHVTLRNYKRNVLRTPANNKLRLDDSRGQEHIKLSTEHSGKSQLNLGHLVDGDRQKRGEGFELRTGGWGAIRAGKGLFISAEEQPGAGGQVLAMNAATAMVEGARQQTIHCQQVALAHNSRQPSLDGLQQLQTDSKGLKGPAILLSAPQGISAVTPASLLLRSGGALYLQSQSEINVAAAEHLSIQANQTITLVARQEGLRLVSGNGPLEIESHGGLLNLIAKQDITVQTAEGHMQLTAKNGITLASGGGFIRITPQGEVHVHSTGALLLKGQHRFIVPESKKFPLPKLPSFACVSCQLAAIEGPLAALPREGQA